ncbi:peptide deformylase [Peptoniphilus obesi]|uniref:peptide deformylase n=1 Tax=Peptoniphilus obesi TaxID=1472765 RepID=UPI0004BC7907|nr:peptide deformylase [Peptoniphilus obesi]
MAIRNIRIDDDPLLRKQSREVTKFDNRLKYLVEDMFETMYHAEGVGLAAPQVGILKRVIVIDDGEDNKLEMVNPVIKEMDGEEVQIEGCLSLPHKQGSVKRATHIVVDYYDKDNNKKTLETRDFLARIIQHEIDHLNGILYSDRAIEMYVVKDNEEVKE